MILPAILLAIVVFAFNLSIQALAAAALVRLVFPWGASVIRRRQFLGRVALLEATMLVLLLTILLQVGVWAAVFVYLNQFPDFQTAFYHSGVNFTTLGYGDLVMSRDTRLLGPLEAINGSIMLGLSGATLFAAVSRGMRETD